MPLVRQHRQPPSNIQLLPVIDPTSDFDSLWGDTGITHPLGSAYLGLYRTERERIQYANDKISNLSSHISLVDDTFPRKMASFVAEQDDTNLSFFEDGGLRLSPSSWLRSIRKKRRPRSAPQVQPPLERLYSPSLKHSFSNTTDTPWRAGRSHNLSSVTIGSASGCFEGTAHVVPSTDDFSFISGRRQSPSSESNEGLNSGSSQSPVSPESSDAESLPQALVKSYRRLEDVASQPQKQNAHTYDNFDSLDGRIIAVSPTCKVFTTEDEIFSDEEVSRCHGSADIDNTIQPPQDVQSRSKASTTKRLSPKSSTGKSLVIATAQSTTSLTSLKSPALSVKSVRFDIPENDAASSPGDVQGEAGLRIDIFSSEHSRINGGNYATDVIYSNPWLEPNTPPPPPEMSRTTPSPPSPGILRQVKSKHPSLAVTGIMRVPLTHVNKPKAYAGDASLYQTEAVDTSSQVETADHSTRPKLPILHEMPSKISPPKTARSMTAPASAMKPQISPNDMIVNGKALKAHRSKSLSDLPTTLGPIHGSQQWRNGNESYLEARNVTGRPQFI